MLVELICFVLDFPSVLAFGEMPHLDKYREFEKREKYKEFKEFQEQYEKEKEDD